MAQYLQPQYSQSDGKGGGGGFILFLMLLVIGFVAWPYITGSNQQKNSNNSQQTQQAETPAQEAAQLKTTVAYKVENRTLETNEYKVVFTNAGGGRASEFYIKDPDRYSKHGENGDYIRSQKPANPDFGGILPFEMTLPYFRIDKETSFQIISDANDTKKVTLRYALPDNSLAVEKTFSTTDMPYILHEEIKLINNSDSPISDELSSSLYIKQIEGEEPSLVRAGSFVAAKCSTEGKMKYLDATDKEEEESYKKDLGWTAVDESYFAIAMHNPQASSCTISNDGVLLKSTQKTPVMISPNSELKLDFDIFMGPKESEYLEPFGHDLPKIIDYGMMEFLAKPMAYVLAFFKNFTGNWGLAIILLTLIVRICLLPLAYKSQMSMLNMSKISPLMQEIQKKYKDNQQKLAEETMKLYKQYNVNPAAGCLPLLIQMPVFFALYRCIFVTGGLYNAPFYFWIVDLSSPDPYFVLPILSVVLLVSQQLLTSTSSQNMQQRVMMLLMPIIFGVMMLFLPSGLCLYMIVSSIISMIQSFYCRRVAAKLDFKPAAVAGDAKNATIDVN